MDWHRRAIKVEHQLKRKKGGGFKFSSPKSKEGIRTIIIGQDTIKILREHQERLYLGSQFAGVRWKENDLIFPTPEELDALVEKIHTSSNEQSHLATGVAASNLDLYQVNCTFYDALGLNDRDYLLARAIQFFAPGVPQVYYVGLLAGENDMALLAKSDVGRDINRHYYTPEEID